MCKRLCHWLQYEENFWPLVAVIGICWLALSVLHATVPKAEAKPLGRPDTAQHTRSIETPQLATISDLGVK